jgi:uncharacterized NAD(P)/FAD-binding protein YdhS
VSRAALAIVGAGPAGSSLLERIAASAPALLGGVPLQIHLIDPHRAGTGRVWRADNHPGLWMNSLAEDVTMFTDDTVTCEGPIVPGPSLYEWARSVDDATLAELGVAPVLADEIRSLTPTTFPTRRVQSAYLEWFHRRVLAGLPPQLEVVVHPTPAVDVRDAGDRQAVYLAGRDEPLLVDAVVLAQGHLDVLPDQTSRAYADFAAAHGLVHVPPGHTAEQDFSAIEPGMDVIALGFGQAFTDLVVLLTEGRGGRFVTGDDGVSLRYEPSGREPVIHVGSRRGVPYRSKLDYVLQAPRARLPKFLDDATIEALLGRDELLDFRRDLLPLVRREIGWAYYHELFNAHPERTTLSWEEFARAYEAAPDQEAIERIVAASVPDPDDVFDIDGLNAPLAGLRFGSAEALHRYVVDHVRADVDRRTNPAYSADLAAFHALLVTFGAIGRLAASGRLTPRSRVQDVNGWWFSFFMYYASGPPPARLRQLLALEEAGLVRFLGADTSVTTDPQRGLFVARSASHPDEVLAPALVESRIAEPSLSRTADELLARLRDRGEVVEEVVTDGDWSANTGKVLVAGPALNLVAADGQVHPARHALGSFTSRPAAGAFSRPRTNAPAFRQHDVIARTLLRNVAERHRPVQRGADDAGLATASATGGRS